MANRLQLRKGTTAQNTAFTGAVGELTYDTEKKQLRVHDGITVGGKVVDDTTRDVTSQVSDATETVAGKAKIATTAIAQEGTNDTDIITAKKLRDALNAGGDAPISACRAWTDISGGTSPSIRAESNILSVVRSGVGSYTVTFKTPMSSSNYIVFFGGNRSGSTGLVGSIQSRTNSSFILRTWSPSDPSDWSDIFIGVFG